MKKAYVKPVMESEAFVANEYVAACWRVQCKANGEEFITTTEPTKGGLDDDGFSYNIFEDEWLYRGDQFTHTGENGLFVKSHYVTVEMKSNGNGPKAS